MLADEETILPPIMTNYVVVIIVRVTQNPAKQDFENPNLLITVTGKKVEVTSVHSLTGGMPVRYVRLISTTTVMFICSEHYSGLDLGLLLVIS